MRGTANIQSSKKQDDGSTLFHAVPTLTLIFDEPEKWQSKELGSPDQSIFKRINFRENQFRENQF